MQADLAVLALPIVSRISIYNLSISNTNNPSYNPHRRASSRTNHKQQWPHHRPQQHLHPHPHPSLSHVHALVLPSPSQPARPNHAASPPSQAQRHRHILSVRPHSRRPKAMVQVTMRCTRPKAARTSATRKSEARSQELQEVLETAELGKSANAAKSAREDGRRRMATMCGA